MNGRPAFPLDVEDWPYIVSNLSGEWPREAILADLQWWCVVGNRPGRPTLAKRWGVSDRRAREYLLDRIAPDDTTISNMTFELRDAFPLNVHPESLSHPDLCHIGWALLQSIGADAYVEPPTAVRLTPDVIGWMDDGTCLLIEAKRTRSDFWNEAYKAVAPAPGHYRWYLTPEDVGYPKPSSDWGMLHVTARGVHVVADAPARALSLQSEHGGELMRACIYDRLKSGWTRNGLGRLVRP